MDIKDEIRVIKLDCFHEYLEGDFAFYKEAGEEHYKLLAYYSTLFDGQIIFDIGTMRGLSALALSYNKKNTVMTFDIVDCVDGHQGLFKKSPKQRENVYFLIMDLFQDETRNKWKSLLLSSPLIMIDIDPHAGQLEYEMYLWLEKEKYKGMILYDDIHLNGGMKDFWSKIPNNSKEDITNLGHYSGTGIIKFI